MKRKVFRAPIELKADGEPGEFRSVFATFNVVDHDGDVTLPGAFREGQQAVIEGWNHDYGLPPGKGVIHADEEKAWVDGRFFLDTTPGKDHYLTLKNLGGLEEWSYTFMVEESERGDFEGQPVQFLKLLDVWGVAPVTRGAGIDTRTVALKGVAGLTEGEIERLRALARGREYSAKAALARHTTATTDADWDGPANEARARSGEDAAYYRRIYAWRDPDGDPEVKASYKFVHHMVGQDGAPGAANVRACQTGIGVLNGGRGGADIPDGDRQGVWNHLAGHLRDADVEPPELKSRSADGDGGGEDTGEGDEGQGESGHGDVEPSGPPPEVVRTQIEIELLSV